VVIRNCLSLLGELSELERKIGDAQKLAESLQLDIDTRKLLVLCLSETSAKYSDSESK
jgi:hypothetical protein